jgi:hypothetical protein
MTCGMSEKRKGGVHAGDGDRVLVDFSSYTIRARRDMRIGSDSVGACSFDGCGSTGISASCRQCAMGVNGMSNGASDERVDRRRDSMVWPADRPFPLTPQEAWWVMQGYAVRPKAELTMEAFLALPGQLELSDGYVMLRQS